MSDATPDSGLSGHILEILYTVKGKTTTKVSSDLFKKIVRAFRSQSQAIDPALVAAVAAIAKDKDTTAAAMAVNLNSEAFDGAFGAALLAAL